ISNDGETIISSSKLLDYSDPTKKKVLETDKIVILGNNYIRTQDNKWYTIKINGGYSDGQLSMSELELVIDWDSMNWYQIDGGMNSYLPLNRILSSNYACEAVNVQDEFVKK